MWPALRGSGRPAAEALRAGAWGTASLSAAWAPLAPKDKSSLTHWAGGGGGAGVGRESLFVHFECGGGSMLVWGADIIFDVPWSQDGPYL